MRNLKVKILIFITLFTSSCFQTSEITLQENVAVKESSPVNVSFCGLVKSQETYKEKSVRLKAVYLLEYHYHRFISFNCESEKPIIMSYEKVTPCNEKSEIEEFDWSSAMADRAHGVIVIGKLDKEPKTKMVSFGKIEYFEFQVECFEKIKQLGWLATEPTKEQRQKIEFFESN